LSFRSAVFAAGLGLSWAIFRYFLDMKQHHLLAIAALEAAFGAVFALKAHASHESLIKQELAAALKWHELFAATCERLHTSKF